MKKLTLASVSLLLLSACASQPETIQTAYISPLQYEKYDCRQLSLEAERISGRTLELYRDLKKTADNDQAQMAVGVILFFPALFFLEGGDDARATEYSRLKGERAAIEKIAVQKSCDLKFQPLAPLQKEKTNT